MSIRPHNPRSTDVVRQLTGAGRVFGADRRGNVSMIFAFGLIPVIGFVGISVDYSRAMHVKTQLQAAADASAMAWAVTKVAANRESASVASFDANTAQIKHGATVTRVAQPGAGNFTIDATASVPTTIMKLLGQNTINVSVQSTVHFGGKKLELALVLDTTGSMNSISSGNKTKLDELKAAVPTILDIVMPSGATDSRVAMVPFASYVNVGTTDTALRTGRVSPYHTKQCVLERKHGSRPNEDAPTNNVDEFWIRTKNSNCASTKPIVPLTSDRTVLDAAMQNLVASGATSGHLGIQWGWHMISPSWSSVWPSGSDPVAYTDETTIKAIVLLTDGNFTEFHRRANLTSAYCTGGSDCPESREEARNYCDAIKDRMNADNKESVMIFTIGFGLEPESTRDGQNARHTMKHCASYVDPSLRDGNDHGDQAKHFYFPVTEADLQAAFSSIGNALTEAVNKPRFVN